MSQYNNFKKSLVPYYKLLYIELANDDGLFSDQLSKFEVYMVRKH